jgi:hypothetical protein
VNRQTNKEFSQECLPACTWKKILLIALESPKLCSTLAVIKELINRRHKELITIKTLKRGEEQRSREFLCGCNGGEFVYCPAAKKNSNGASLMVFNS